MQRVLVTGGARRRTSFRGAVRRFTPYGAASYGAGAALYGAGRRTTRVGVVQRQHRTAIQSAVRRCPKELVRGVARRLPSYDAGKATYAGGPPFLCSKTVYQTRPAPGAACASPK